MMQASVEERTSLYAIVTACPQSTMAAPPPKAKNSAGVKVPDCATTLQLRGGGERVGHVTEGVQQTGAVS